MRVEAYAYLGLWFRVVPAENHREGCFLRGAQHRRFSSEESAIASWNTRAAVTDHDFAMAVHDGELWGKCSECRERQGYYMDAETIRNQQERIAELDDELRKSYDAQGVKAEELVKRDVLIREMARELRGLNDDGVPTDCMEHERRMRELGVEVE